MKLVIDEFKASKEFEEWISLLNYMRDMEIQ